MARFRSRVGALAAVLALGTVLPAMPAHAAATGTFGGMVFTDGNANGVADPGEGGLAGVTIGLFSDDPSGHFEQMTDATGRFSFGNLPVARYHIQYRTQDRWAVYGLTGRTFELVEIDDSPRYSNVVIPAVRPLEDSFGVDLVFDRETYPADATVALTVVLTNRGAAPVTGVTEQCAPSDGSGLPGGQAWGALARGGPGMTIPPGSTKVVVVTQPMPAAAPRLGHVQVACPFRAAHYPDDASVWVEDQATVPGVAGSGHGRVYHDRNANRSIDDGEALSGVTVVLTDQHTGVPIGRSVTDENGEFAAADLPAAVYDLHIDGPWQPQSTTGDGFHFPVVAGTPVPDLSFDVVPGLEFRPNLNVSATFDKPAYNSGDTVRARVTLSNIGVAPATGVRMWGSNVKGPTLDVHSTAWGDLDPFGPGARIEPGATRVVEIAAAIKEADAGVILFGVIFNVDGGDLNFANNRFRIVAPVTQTHGTFAGTVYVDKNNNLAVDPGEALPSVPISISGGVPFTALRQTTDAGGKFAFRDIPTGRYRAIYEVLGEVIGPGARDEFAVEGHGAPEVLVRVVRPLSEFLTSSITFTKRSYSVGETAHLTVTLTNRGAQALSGITAWCNGGGFSFELPPGPEGWGDLVYPASGVTLGAHETRTFDVWSVVPQGSLEYGVVTISCAFGAPPEAPGNPIVGDVAKVPGASGPAVGVVLHDRNANRGYDEGEGIADTKVVLVDNDTGQVVARGRTDARGRVDFGTMPAGRYGFRVVGPWKPQDPSLWFQVIGRATNVEEGWMFVVPGPNQPDPDAPPAPDPIPQGGVAGRTGGLASTGVSVLGMLTGGLAALLVGGGLILVRRRQEDGFIRPNR